MMNGMMKVGVEPQVALTARAVNQREMNAGMYQVGFFFAFPPLIVIAGGRPRIIHSW
jgi:hypothetical protein